LHIRELLSWNEILQLMLQGHCDAGLRFCRYKLICLFVIIICRLLSSRLWWGVASSRKNLHSHMMIAVFKVRFEDAFKCQDYLASATQKLGTCMRRLWHDTGRETPKYSEKLLPPCPFVNHRFHIDLSIVQLQWSLMSMDRNSWNMSVMLSIVIFVCANYVSDSLSTFIVHSILWHLKVFQVYSDMSPALPL
jgi:hypothetical protein